jgi:hypothetical protein
MLLLSNIRLRFLQDLLKYTIFQSVELNLLKNFIFAQLTKNSTFRLKG